MVWQQAGWGQGQQRYLSVRMKLDIHHVWRSKWTVVHLRSSAPRQIHISRGRSANLLPVSASTTTMAGVIGCGAVSTWRMGCPSAPDASGVMQVAWSQRVSLCAPSLRCHCAMAESVWMLASKSRAFEINWGPFYEAWLGIEIFIEFYDSTL